MGFGYLFIGYLFFFNVAYADFTNAIGILLMMYGLSTLRIYGRGFKSAMSASVPLLIVSLFSFAFALLDLVGLSVIPDELSAFASIASHLLSCVMLWQILSGIRELSCETGIPALEARALRNRLLTPVYYTLAVLTEVPTVFGSSFVYFGMARLLFGLVFTFLCAKCFFECYIWICLEGDENMEEKKGGSGILGKLNSLSAKIDEKTLARKSAEREEKQNRKKNADEEGKRK